MKNRVVVSSVGGDWRLFYLEARKIANLFLLIMGEKNRYLEIYFLDNKRIGSLNKRFRGKNGPTDVLTFLWPPFFKFSEPSQKPLGEVYLSLNYIKARGADWRYLLIHGLLHILGFDHIRKDDRIKMERAEKKIWQKIFS